DLPFFGFAGPGLRGDIERVALRDDYAGAFTVPVGGDFDVEAAGFAVGDERGSRRLALLIRLESERSARVGEKPAGTRGRKLEDDVGAGYRHLPVVADFHHRLGYDLGLDIVHRAFPLQYDDLQGRGLGSDRVGGRADHDGAQRADEGL